MTSYIATYATHEQAFQWTKATATHYDKISIVFFSYCQQCRTRGANFEYAFNFYACRNFFHYIVKNFFTSFFHIFRNLFRYVATGNWCLIEIGNSRHNICNVNNNQFSMVAVRYSESMFQRTFSIFRTISRYDNSFVGNHNNPSYY